MATDEALLVACTKGEAGATLRLYSWEPPAVSIGYAQDVAQELNYEACQAKGLKVVRRPTGGRGILHQRELTYSIIAPRAWFPEGGVLATYRFIAQGLIQGLRHLGVRECIVAYRTKANRQRTPRPTACFMAPSWYEITVGGKKLIGSAQRRLGPSLLQQGSILLDIDYDLLVEVFYQDHKADKMQLIKEAKAKITCLRALLDKDIEIGRLKQALVAGFSQAWGVQFVPDALTEGEQELAHKLYLEKYSNPDWNKKVIKHEVLC